MLYVEDKRLFLPDGRTLAYANSGNTSSSVIVLFFHGAFSIGDASRLPPILVEKNVHFIAPSLPGWGKSSPVPNPAFYAETLSADITALFASIHHPGRSKIKIYLCGDGFGTIAAQMLYGLPSEVFPLRKALSALVLLSPYSPPRCHRDYSANMSWHSYFFSGPPAPYIPFNIVARLTKLILSPNLGSEQSAERFMRINIFDRMDEEERDVFVKWCEDNEIQNGQFERQLVRNAARSVAESWRGFLDIPAVYHSGWCGRCSTDIDESSHDTTPAQRENNNPSILIVAPGSEMMAEWLAGHYPSAALVVVERGPLSPLFRLDEVWKAIL